jgi:large subunit ribosomal protein L21
MYAVIETGGKQYRVEVGTELEVEKLDVEAGQTLTLDRVLLVADGDEAAIGRPIVDGATVSAEVVRQGRADKVIVFRYRPKARRRVKKGHRQDQTILRISDITFGGKSAKAQAKQAADAAKTERQRLEEAAARQAAADAELAAKLVKSAVKPAKAKAERKAKAVPETKAEPKATAKAQSEEPSKATTTDAPKGRSAKAAPADAEAAPADAEAAPAVADAEAKPKRRATKKDE